MPPEFPRAALLQNYEDSSHPLWTTPELPADFASPSMIPFEKAHIIST
jgi:hypothetical protein